ncbi:hypothetical protein [Ideonella alba]|uniref:Thymidylate kinase n=1 Tax=Ideonella alba TaxID=2824118 RepID=A0A941BJK1_9BURK|nr:hypothetical protein [Ideonella alba]MBQ0929179.1 hypothetical protein [Ideonella alba]
MITHPSLAVDPESAFLLRIFYLFKEHGIRYAVMRNYFSLPNSAGGSDLDILCLDADLVSAQNLLQRAAEDAEGVCIGTAESPDVVKTHYLGRSADFASGWWGLKVDLFPGFRFCGLPLLTDDWHHTEVYHGAVRVLPDGLSGLLGVLKEVLNNEILPERYVGAARAAHVRDWPRMRALLTPMGERALQLLEQLLDASCDTEVRPALCRQLRRAFMVHALTRRPFQTMDNLVRFQYSKVFRYVRPSGLMLAVLGVDGAGKSTVIEAIKPALDDATHHALMIEHLRPALLPPLGRLKGGGQTSGPVTDPHGQTPSGLVLSLFRLFYLTLDYILGYWILIRPQISRLPNVVIFDRYAYDIAIDPRRFRIKLPQAVIRALVRFAPRPDLVVCLHGSAEAIAQRKHELSVDETSRQISALLAFAARTRTAVLISTTQGIEETRDLVLGAIVGALKARNHPRS